ncbi:MAG: MBL fold metallo-hydrolase [Actinobacteria bacterium]|nr:MBL fold metallo-hydrolase [Actinomycetota bacterium]
MRVHVIGSSGTFPAPGRPAAGFLIEHRGTRVWCDAGPGTFVALPVDPDLVDAVVISHQHADHCSDILTAFHAWTYRPQPREGIPILAPESVWDRVCGFVDKGQEPVIDRTFSFRPVADGDTARFGDLEVSFTGMNHSVPAVGSRWEADDRTLFYTGDTGPGGAWREAARDVDVMLSEASYQESTKDPGYPMHLSAAEAGLIAREMGVHRLVLTHIPPYLDVSQSIHEAEQTFDRPVSAAVPGANFDV